MISRNPAPFLAFVTRYNTTIVDCMVSWSLRILGEGGTLSCAPSADAVAGNGLRPAQTQSRQRHHGPETNTSARTRGPGIRHTLGMGARAWH